MPWGLKRFHDTDESHFVTFSCYHHRPFLATTASRRTFELALERVRHAFRLRVYGYVVMPDHVHLLLSEPERQNLADALKSLKQGVSRRLLTMGGPLKPAFGLSGKRMGGPFKPAFGLSGKDKHFWQKRYYDFNVRNQRQFIEKLRYIHRNPVRAGLCERPEDWAWSSFRHYATGYEGTVEIESEWTARKRQRAEGRLCPAVEFPHSMGAPLKPGVGLSGHGAR